jgi:hypothetical protein
MDLLECPHCGTLVVPMSSGDCPSCRRGIVDWAFRASDPPGESGIAATDATPGGDDADLEDEDDEDSDAPSGFMDAVRRRKRAIAWLLLTPSIASLLMVVFVVLDALMQWFVGAFATVGP